MENNEFKIICIKYRPCYCLEDIIRLEDIGFNNILIE